MAGKKRKLDEWDVSEIAESGGAAVHGVVTNLSPVKESKKNTSVQYFHGTISDGRKVYVWYRLIRRCVRRWKSRKPKEAAWRL